jgi:hypothetical protein
MSDSDAKAWDLFRNIVGLAKGAEEHAAEVERAACCAVVLEAGDARTAAIAMVVQHMAAVQQFADGARTYCQQLRALAESSGDDIHLRNGESVVSRAEKAEAYAREASEALVEYINDRPFGNPVCRMTGL